MIRASSVIVLSTLSVDKSHRMWGCATFNQAARFKELEVPASAQEAHRQFVTMFQNGHVTCGRVFVNTVKKVVAMEKKAQEPNFHAAPERGRPSPE